MPTLEDLVDELTRRGFTEHFRVEAGRLHGVDQHSDFAPGDVRIEEVQRFEGASDPDDMAIVYALASTSGVKGTLVDAFGTYSDPAVSEFMRCVSFDGDAEPGSRSGMLARPD